MAVRIRMKRIGAKNNPVFRIVVADGRSPRDGKFIEQIGTYQPLKKGDNFALYYERAKYCIGKGAQPSDTGASVIRKVAKAASNAPAAPPAAPPPRRCHHRLTPNWPYASLPRIRRQRLGGPA